MEKIVEHQTLTLPTSEDVNRVLNKIKRRRDYIKTLTSTINTLIIVAALAVLISMLYLPVLRVYGESMEPALYNGEVLVAVRERNFVPGDVIAFYYHNKVLLKRVIANPGDTVDMDAKGNIYINGTYLDEPYLVEKAVGYCDITFPYQIPDNRYFVLGDHRSTSVDSRSTEVGTIADEQIVGKVIWRIWPMNKIVSFR